MSDWAFNNAASNAHAQPETAAPPNAVASPATALDIASLMEAAAQTPTDRTRAHGLLQKALEADRLGKRVDLHLPGLESAADGSPVALDGSELLKSLAANSLAPKPTPIRTNNTLDALDGYTGINGATSITGRTNAFLEAVSRSPAVQLIQRTRINQAKPFCKRPQFKGDVGFTIRQVDSRRQLTGAAAKERDALEEFFLYGGYRWAPDGSLRRRKSDGQPGVWDGNEEVQAGGLEALVSTMIRNALSLDWAPVRMEPGKDEKTMPIAWFSNCDVDAKQILRTHQGKYQAQIDKSGLPISFVELEPGSAVVAPLVRREFPWNRMGVMVRNPRTDFFGLGYGYSETEAAIEVLASLILNLKFRGEYFDNNHIPPAIVVMRGQLAGFSDSSLGALRTQLAMKTGSVGAFFKLLYLGLPPDEKADIKILPLRNQTGAVNEMEYAQSDFQALMTLLCALFAIDPAEVGFKSAGEGNSLNEADPETKIEHSKDKGLVPLLSDVATFLNKNVMSVVNPEFEFVFEGLNPSLAENDQKAQARLALGDTPNEIKDAQDRPRDLHAIDTVLHTKSQRKFKPENFDTPEEWRDKVDTHYEGEFVKKYGEDIDPWSTAWDEPVGNVEMMQTVQAEKQALAAAKQQQQSIQDLIDQGYSPEDAKRMAKQQAQQQGPPGGDPSQGGDPGQDGGAPDGMMPGDPNAGPQDGVQPDAPMPDGGPQAMQSPLDADGGAGEGAQEPDPADAYDAEEDDQDWERGGGARSKLAKSLGHETALIAQRWHKQSQRVGGFKVIVERVG